MHLKILHTTTYHFDHPVPYGLQQLRLFPKSRAGQVVKSWSWRSRAGRNRLEFNDHHQNRVTLISFDPHATSIVVHCEGEVENADLHGVIGKHGGFAPLWYFRRSTPLTRAGPMSGASRKGARQGGGGRRHPAAACAVGSASCRRCPMRSARPMPPPPPRRRSSMARRLPGSQPYLRRRRARHGLSGALCLGLPDDERPRPPGRQPRLGRSHVEGVGWVGFDVSNGISPDARYVRVATGLDYREAAPVSGLRFGRCRRRGACPSTSRCSSSSVAGGRRFRETGAKMTYCVGLKLNRGLVFMSDTRTNAGVDNISVFRKMFLWEGRASGHHADDRGQPRHHAGRRQPARRALQGDGARRNPRSSRRRRCSRPPLVGETLREVIQDQRHRAARGRQPFNATLILGGQVRGGRAAPVHDLSRRQFHRGQRRTRPSSRSARPNTAGRSWCAPMTRT
jgi:hypothetical protein